MPYTLMTAAEACGINRSTVLRAIKSGKISATKDELTGAWLIEPAEMHRLYPPVAVPEARPVAMPRHAQGDSTDALVAELRAVIADLRRNQEDLRQERDKWQAAFEREQSAHAAAQRLLLPAPAGKPRRKGLLERIFATG
jgi:hypothetical protein